MIGPVPLRLRPTVIAKTEMKPAESPLRAAMAEGGVVGRLPAALATVALIDASTAAAAGGMGLSWWYSEVAAGRAPSAAVRRARCTRWRLADVVSFWIAFADSGAADANAAQVATARATKASRAAQARRAATLSPLSPE